MSTFLEKLFRPLSPPSKPIKTPRERQFVSHFPKHRVVHYSGREDMCGLRIVGDRMGFEIVRNSSTGRLYVQSLDVRNGTVIQGSYALFLRGKDTLESVIPKIKKWVS